MGGRFLLQGFAARCLAFGDARTQIGGHVPLKGGQERCGFAQRRKVGLRDAAERLLVEIDPDERPLARLPLDPLIGRVVPGDDLPVLVVEHEFATVGFHQQHRMAVAVPFADHGKQQLVGRPSPFDQQLAFQQRQVLAVAAAFVGDRPPFGALVEHHVVDLRDRPVDPVVDLGQFRPARGRQFHFLRRVGAAGAFIRVADAEADIAVRGRRLLTGRHRGGNAIFARAVIVEEADASHAVRRLAAGKRQCETRRQKKIFTPRHLATPIAYEPGLMGS